MSTQDNVMQNANLAGANIQKSVADRIKENIQKNQEVKKGMVGDFLKIETGEMKLLQFTGDFEPVDREFKRKDDDGNEVTKQQKRFAYKVIDLSKEGQDEGIKIWEVSKTWSDMIDNFLVEGFTALKVKREGAGTGTKYLITPIAGNK